MNQRRLSRMNDFESGVAPSRIKVIKYYLHVASLYLLVFVPVFAFMYHNPVVLAVHVLDIIVIALCYRAVYGNGDIEKVSLALSSIAFMTVISVTATGGAFGSGPFLVFPYLPFVTFLRPPKSAYRWMIAMLLCLMALFALGIAGYIYLPYEAPMFGFYIFNFVIAILLITAYINEKSRSDNALQNSMAKSKKTQSMLFKAARNLEKEKSQLEAAKIRNQALLSSIGEGLVYIDKRGNIADLNPVALQMLGYEKNELIGKYFPSHVKAYDGDGKSIPPSQRPATKALKEAKTTSTTLGYERKDKSIFTAHVTVSPAILEGKPIGAVEVFRDATEENKLERAKQDFVSIASHQLRTPASGVKAFLSMLLDNYAGELKPDQIKFLKKAYESNERQLKIVSEMLNVARVEAGRLIPEFESSDIIALISDIADEQGAEIKTRKQILDINMPARLMAEIDPSFFRMLIENILSNASKYTQDGGEITLTVTETKNNFTVSIQDNGVGIPKKDYDKLYKRFSRIKNKLSDRGGSGLGLYLAGNVVELHNGSISVDSTVGEGTLFTITLPILNSVQSSKEKDTRNVVQ